MRLEVINRQLVQHAAVLALIGAGVIGGHANAAESQWQPWSAATFKRAQTGQKAILLSIEYPSCHGCGATPPATAFVPVILDPDEYPRTAAAYLNYAASAGIAVDIPLRIVVTAYLEPLAVVQTRDELAMIEKQWQTSRDKLIADAGLALRRVLSSGTIIPFDPDRPVKRAATPDVVVLQDMAATALYDQIGGGFHHRARDSEWHMPRFEKLLRDQAVLAIAYTEAWQRSKDAVVGDVARATLEQIARDFQDRRTARFFTGLHADSLVARKGPETLEGGAYVWQAREISHLLGSRAGDVFALHFGVKSEGNVPAPFDPIGDFAGKNVLYVATTASETRARFGLTETELNTLMAAAKPKLFEVRANRPPPRLDSSVITAYNGLAISALARGGVVFGEKRWIDAAVRAARSFAAAKTIVRTGSIPARAEDFSLLVGGLLDAYEASFDVALLEKAAELQGQQARPVTEESVPDAVGAFAPPVAGQSESARARATLVARNIVIAGEPGADDTNGLIEAARRHVAGNDMIFVITSKSTRKRLARLMPYVTDIVPIEKHAVGTLCERGSCRTATTDAQRLIAWLQ